MQASLRRNPAPDPRFDPSAMENALGPLTFEVGQKAIFLGRAYYGCVATVLPDVSAGLTRKVSSLMFLLISPKVVYHYKSLQFSGGMPTMAVLSLSYQMSAQASLARQGVHCSCPPYQILLPWQT